jgi:hypothetical protein
MSDAPRRAEPDFARTGNCLCGAVSMEIAQPAIETYHCHCSMCRRASGSLYQTYSVYAKQAIRIVQGADGLRTYESSPGTRRRFCDRCGCQVMCEVATSPDIVFVNTGVLDGRSHPGHARDKERHIYVADKVAWLHLGEELPKIDQSP